MKIRLLILILLLSSVLQAQLTFSAYPYIAYSSETKLMIGAFSFAAYEFAKAEAEPVQIDLLSNTIYTQNKQFLVVLIPRLRHHNWMLESDLLFQDWPDTFYGIGNSTDPDVSEPFSSRLYSSQFSLRTPLAKSFTMALITDLGWHELTKVEQGGMLLSSDVSGKADSFLLGSGLALRYDNTDGSYFPRQGVKMEAKQLWYESAWGSDFEYRQSSLDARGYLPLSPNQVLAAQSDLQANTGDVPFFRYPELGNRLRAYDSKRFIDQVRISQRIEHRVFPFHGNFTRRIGFVSFVETGQVASEFDLIRLRDWHWSVGAGLRFSILPEQRLNLRADIGFGEDSVNVIINAREVF